MRNTIRGLLTTTCLIAVAAPAMAQTGPSATPTEASEAVEADAQSAETLPAETRAERNRRRAAERKEDDAEVIVTGTRIVNPNIKSAAPIQSLSAAEIKASGAVSIEEALNRLPQVYPINYFADQETAGQAQIQLRSFGSGKQSAGNTLPLIDGQRIAGPLAIDVNAIPTSLVERIDVLTGGAAAVYGPDALAGVVNFILKKDFEGVQLDASYGFFNHLNRRNIVTETADRFGLPYQLGTVNDGGRANLNIAVGRRFFDDRLSVSGYFSYRHTDPIFFGARSISACQLVQSQIDQPTNCTVTTRSPYGRIFVQSGPNSGQTFVNASDGVSRVLRPFTAADQVSQFGPSYQLLRGNDRYNAGAFFKFEAADWAEFYGSFMGTKNKSTASYDPTTIYAGRGGAAAYQVNCNNPLMSAQQAQAICGAAAAGTNAFTKIDIHYRYLAYDPQTIDYTQRILRGTLGVRGEFGDAWNYDIGGVYVKSTNRGVISSNWSQNIVNINRALNVVNVGGVPTCVAKVNGTDPNCVPLDVFKGLAGTPAEYSYIFESIAPGASGSTNYFADVMASLSGDLGNYGIRSPLATDGIQVGLNLEVRRESVYSYAEANYRTILAGAPNPDVESRAAQTTKEIGGEIQIPLVQDQPWTKSLSFSGGYRLSKYGDVKKLFETWKVEGIWSPVEDITFRGSFNKASRAPNVYEATPTTSFRQISFVDPCGPTPMTNNSGQTTFGAPQFSIESCRQQRGWQDSFYGNPVLLCPESGCVFRDGIADNLGPQEAESYTYGILLQPRFLPRFTFSIDRYQIQFTNQISAFGQGDFVDLCRQYALQQNDLNRLGCDHFYRNTNGTLYGSTSSPQSGFVSSETLNIPGKSSRAKGIDLQAHYDFPIASLGKFNVDMNGSITERAGVNNGKAGYFSVLVGDPIPKWRHNARFTFETPEQGFQVSFNWRYIGGTESGLNHVEEITGTPLAPGAIPGFTLPQKTFAKINPYSYFDLGLSTTIADRLTLSLVVNNLLDKDPPIVPAYGGFGTPSVSGGYQNAVTNFYDLYGRYIQVGVSAKF